MICSSSTNKLWEEIQFEALLALRLNTYFGQLIGQMNKWLPGEYDMQKWVQARCSQHCWDDKQNKKKKERKNILNVYLKTY